MTSIDYRRSTPEYTEGEFRLAFSKPPLGAACTDARSTPPGIPLERYSLASARIRYLSDLIAQLIELREEQLEQGVGESSVSPDAFESACRLITDAAIGLAQIGKPVPHGIASDDDGGVRVEWFRPKSNVHLVLKKNGAEGFIYWQRDGAFGGLPLSSIALTEALQSIPD